MRQRPATPPADPPARYLRALDDPTHLASASEKLQLLQRRIGAVVIGQEQAVRVLLAGLLAEGHVLLIGVPGLAKTLLVRTLADGLGWGFRRIQFTPDLMPADITGMELLDEDQPGHRSMRFVPGPVFTDLLLADEINRTPPKTQAALLEAMQERQVTSMGTRHAIERPFMVVATQNPIEQEGTYPLPEAQLDRFLLSCPLAYPPRADERRVVEATTGEAGNEGARIDAAGLPTKEELMEAQKLVRRVPAPPHVVDLALDVARLSRPTPAPAAPEPTGRKLLGKKKGEPAGTPDGPHTTVAADKRTPAVAQLEEWVRSNVAFGAGPRAAQAMVLAAKALAVIDGEPAATVKHVREAAPFVLRHRVIPGFSAAGSGTDADAVVAKILAALD